MEIKKKRIRKADKYLTFIDEDTFRIASPDLTSNTLNKLSLKPADLFEGLTFLPKSVGPISKFNAEGKHLSLKDLPKKDRYICQREWTWKDWGGNEHYTIIDITRKCYQRKFIEPPSTEFTLNENKFYSAVLNKDNKEEIVHTINLFLELFGSCELVKGNFENFPKIEKRNWEFLPSGEYPFDKIQAYIKKKKPNPTLSIPIENRHEFLYSKAPEKIAIGSHGFSGYVMYFFKKYLVLDCINYGNAIYIFNKDQENISTLPKKEILDNELNIDRIIHNKGWQASIAKYFKTA